MKFLSKVILGAGVFLAACSLNNTRMLQSWTNPQQGTTPIHFNKILVVAVAPTDTDRRTAEDAMVAQIGAKATPSYNLLNADELKNIETAKSRINSSAFDGVIVLRWLGFRNEKEVVATPTYSPMWDHYSYSWTYMQESTVVQWTVLQLETRIFSVAEQKLMWSGTTETVEPKAIPKLIKDVAAVVKKEMGKQDLLPPSTEVKK